MKLRFPLHKAAKAAKAGEQAHGVSNPAGGGPHWGVKQTLGVGVVSGVAANAINQKVNYHYAKHEYEKSSMYKRKLKDGRQVKVQKALTHGVGAQQRSRQTVVMPNPNMSGGGTNGVY